MIWISILLLAVGILIFQRASLIVATLGLGVLLGILTLLLPLGILPLSIWMLLAILFNVKWLRRRLISAWVFKLFSKNLPRFSPTEKAVLAAGATGWETEIFSGMPDLQSLQDMPWVKLTAPEQAFLDGPVNDLCRMIDPWDIHRQQHIPESVWEFLKQQGFWGLAIPAQYGGKGFSAYAQAQVIVKLASVSTAIATIASVPNSLGPAELLLHYGTEEQKQFYLPRLACGKEVPCFALTSPVAGSDAAAIVDSGVVCRLQKNGREILGIRLNWDKRYITLAPVATLVGLAFKLYDPEHLLGPTEEIGITCALIRADTPGVSIGRHHIPLMCAFPNGPTQGEDVIVELDAIIGGRIQAGKGWQMLMERLAAGRGISLPSMVVGSIKAAVVASGAYARTRRQFNTYIGNFGGVREVLAQIAGDAYLAEALRLFTLAQVNQGVHSATAAAISKYHTTELGREIIRAAMDIHGGKAIIMGPRNYLAQLHIESPIAITVEGANILTRCLIIFGQGALRSHPFLWREMEAVIHQDQKTFDEIFFAHVGYLFSNQLRAIILNFSGHFSKSHQKFSGYCALFAAAADLILITQGSSLKRQENLSARLGDLLSDLYMAAAVLKMKQSHEDSEALASLADVCCAKLYQDFLNTYHQITDNLPAGTMKCWLKFLGLFWCKARAWDNDNIAAKIAHSLMEPGAVRNFFAAGAFWREPLCNLENDLQKIIDAEPLLKKRHQQGLDSLTPQESEILRVAEIIRAEIIRVDDFPPL